MSNVKPLVYSCADESVSGQFAEIQRDILVGRQELKHGQTKSALAYRNLPFFERTNPSNPTRPESTDAQEEFTVVVTAVARPEICVYELGDPNQIAMTIDFESHVSSVRHYILGIPEVAKEVETLVICDHD